MDPLCAKESGMETAFVGNNFHLLERYPELLLLLSYTSEEIPLSAFEENAEDHFLENVNLAGVDIFYVYGTGLGLPYNALKTWLKEKRERRLIFLEDDRAALHALLASDVAESIFLDSQVVIQWIDSKQLDAKLDELIYQYPCDRIEVA